MRLPVSLDTTPAILFCFDQLVRGGLRGVWIRGAVPIGPFVWAANHHSWWDGFVANAALRDAKHDAALVMDATNLKQFSFLRRAGVVSADSPREALASLSQGSALIIFPESELRPAGGVGLVAPGAVWLARHAAVPLVLAVTRVVLRGQQSPEAYVDLRPYEQGDLRQELDAGVRVVDAELAASDPCEPLPGFTCVVKGRPSWDERITAWAGRVRR